LDVATLCNHLLSRVGVNATWHVAVVTIFAAKPFEDAILLFTESGLKGPVDVLTSREGVAGASICPRSGGQGHVVEEGSCARSPGT